MAESENPLQAEDKNEWDTVGYRDGNLFIVDLIPEMFAENPETQSTYFEQCLQTYGRILSQKLSLNRRDWMGLVFFCTKKWDMDPETKHILTVQKFEEITAGKLKEVMSILRSQVDEYKEMSTEDEYPLHDVLWHAARCFDSVKVAMTRRQIILITCRDNPFSEDEPERHKIRLRAKTFSDINVNLRILGLGNDWNHDLFYKDIEMLANNIKSEDITRMMLEDLEVQLRFDSRPLSHLKLRIGEGLHIRAVISSFSGPSRFLKQVKMSRETNEILDVFRHLGQVQTYNDESDEENEEDVVTSQAPDDTRRAITRGGELISFGLKEIRKIRNPGPKGIDLLGFKETSLDLRYHIGAPKFVGVETAASDEEKELFTALLYQCEKKNVMGICVVHDRGAPYLAKLIPCIKYGGFYLYRIAFREQVNQLDDYINMYVDGGETDQETLIDEEGLNVMKKVVKKLRINWDPYMFRNPKLHAQFAYIEALALDTEAEAVEDNTLPPTEMIEQKLANLAVEYNEVFPEAKQEAPKRPSGASRTRTDADKNVKFDDYMIQGLVDSGRIKECTIPVLKAIARSLGGQTTGKKADLLKEIIEKFQAKKAR